MVVYRKEQNDSDIITGNTAAQSIEEASNETQKNSSTTSLMVPRAILTSRPNSHPFGERHLSLDQPAKVGRSVARCRPSLNNAIFDCKVLSRNHALLWYENGKFYLQDTKSSNGTFVNNQRLSKGSEESPAREVCSGDIVQFGVDVVENSRKVVHGCIVATLKLYLPDGKEAKASPTTAVASLSSEAAISSQELYQLSQFIQEALHREQILENKLGTLQKVVANTQDESDIGWKALIEEDRLLSRIETLESQLQTCGKNVTEEKLREDVLKLQEDKDKYQNAAKESLKKVLQEKLEAVRKVQDLENSLSKVESECSHLKEVNKNIEQEMQYVLNKSAENEKEVNELTEKLKEAEEKYQDLANQAAEEKASLENSIEELKKEEQSLQAMIEALQAENDFAKEQLVAVKAHFELYKKDQHSEDKIEKNGIYSPTQDDLDTSEKEIVERKNLIQELSSEVNRLELELKRVQEENKKNEIPLTISYAENDCHTNGDIKSVDYINQLQSEIQQLRKLLAEARESKRISDAELISLRGEFDVAQNSVKKMDDECLSLQQQLVQTKQHLKDKAEQVTKLENQLSEFQDKKEYSNINEKTEEEISQEKLQETERLHDRLHEIQQQLKQSQNESEKLKKKINDLSEQLQTKKMDNKTASEFENLREECAKNISRIQVLESEIRKCKNENTKLEAENKTLQEKCMKLDAAKIALETKSDDYWKEQVVTAKSETEAVAKQLRDALEEIVLVKERFSDCNQEKSKVQAEKDALTEQLRLLSVQSKAVSACSVIPLIILILAVMLAFYPSLSHLTATSDQT